MLCGQQGSCPSKSLQAVIYPPHHGPCVEELEAASLASVLHPEELLPLEHHSRNLMLSEILGWLHFGLA